MQGDEARVLFIAHTETRRRVSLEFEPIDTYLDTCTLNFTPATFFSQQQFLGAHKKKNYRVNNYSYFQIIYDNIVIHLSRLKY